MICSVAGVRGFGENSAAAYWNFVFAESMEFKVADGNSNMAEAIPFLSSGPRIFFYYAAWYFGLSFR